MLYVQYSMGVGSGTTRGLMSDAQKRNQICGYDESIVSDDNAPNGSFWADKREIHALSWGDIKLT